MVRGFVSGLVWGGVVAVSGLAVISQVAPRPMGHTPEAPPVTDTPAVPVADTPLVPADAPVTAIAPAEPTPAAPPPAEAPLPTDEPPSVAAPERAPVPPATETPIAPTAPEAAMPAPAVPSGENAPDRMVAAPAAAPLVPAEPAPAAADLPPPPPLTPEEEALLTPPPAAATPETVPDPEVPLADAPRGTEPSADPAQTPRDVPRVIEPGAGTGLPGKKAESLPAPDPSVDMTTLPQIGVEPPAAMLPEPAMIDELPPILAFARPFENPDAKPLFSILLVDDGRPELDRAALAALPFPVTFVVDPQAPNAAEAAAIYRTGLQEVVMAATGLPPEPAPADVEQSFQANAVTLPETVAVIEPAPGGFGAAREVAQAIMPVLKDQGRGLVTYDEGLNAADQAARREAVPAATIFRVLDAQGESTLTIRRYLDRAAFKAAQEGRVLVIGSTRAETVAAILEWTVEGRAASVALAPVTAVLVTP